MSIRGLAKLTRMSASYISLIERGIMPAPSDAKLDSLSRVLGIKAADLYIEAGRLPKHLRRLIETHTAESTKALERLWKRIGTKS